MAKTQRDIIIEGLLARGSIELTNKRTNRTRVFTRFGASDYYYVGKAGSLRLGPTKAQSLTALRLKAELLGVTKITYEKEI